MQPTHLLTGGIVTWDRTRTEGGHYYAPSPLEQRALEAMVRGKIKEAGKLYDEVIVANPMLAPRIGSQCRQINNFHMVMVYGPFLKAVDTNDPAIFRYSLKAVCMRVFGYDNAPQKVRELMKQVTWWAPNTSPDTSEAEAWNNDWDNASVESDRTATRSFVAKANQSEVTLVEGLETPRR